MSNTNVTIRMDEALKAQLQKLLSDLGLDLTTFFTMVAKQAVREQALPFRPDMKKSAYNIEAYYQAIKNTKYNKEGKAVISTHDEWANETEWDELFEKIKKERGM